MKEVRYGLKAIDCDDYEKRLGTYQCKRQPLSIQAPGKPGRVTVPHPKRDLPKGTVHSILKQAGLR
jgi:hypothetical protein